MDPEISIKHALIDPETTIYKFTTKIYRHKNQYSKHTYNGPKSLNTVC